MEKNLRHRKGCVFVVPYKQGTASARENVIQNFEITHLMGRDRPGRINGSNRGV